MDQSLLWQSEPVSYLDDVQFESPFKSFWMGGYECADQMNAFGNRVDLLSDTGHIRNIDRDYADLDVLGIKTVREGIRWSRVEVRPYEYHWDEVKLMIAAGKMHGIQQLWDICHFGFPDDLTPLHPMFARRFAAICRSFAGIYRSIIPDGELIVTPINEVSFLSWLGGDVKGTSPYCQGQGWQVKYALMKAYIEGIIAMKEVDPNIKILATEPLINIVSAPYADEEEILNVFLKNEEQFQVLDILTGRMCPELSGSSDLLDIIGYNFYYNNQWEFGSNRILEWHGPEKDYRYTPLNDLIQNYYTRYQKPLIIAETSHPGIHRPEWMHMIGIECHKILENDIPLWGVCWYPLLNRPDWDNPSVWHNSGIWEGNVDEGNEARTVHSETKNEFIEAQIKMEKYFNRMTDLNEK